MITTTKPSEDHRTKTAQKGNRSRKVHASILHLVYFTITLHFTSTLDLLNRLYKLLF